MTRSGYAHSASLRLSKLFLATAVTSALTLWADPGTVRQPGPTQQERTAIVFVQTPKISNETGVDRFAEGSQIVVAASDRTGKAPAVLTQRFFAAGDPQIDFTGKRVLFAGQRGRGEHWQIWEMNLDGSGEHRITNCEGNCIRPAYLPADEIVFTSLKSGHVGSSLMVSRIDGANPRPITFGPGDWWVETVLRDGRIVASANSPLKERAGRSTNRLLYTLRPDGTGLESLRCEHTGNAHRSEASELENGSIVFVKDGDLAIVKRGAANEQRIPGRERIYRFPSELNDSSIVVARRASTGRYQIAVLPMNGSGSPNVIFADAKIDALQPVAVKTRPIPKRFWSNLILSSKTGYFVSLDSTNSTDKPIGAGAVKSVRVVAQRPEGEVVLGEAPVEADGSFYLRVPANSAVRFVLLDAGGNVVREEQSWVWTRPGEERGCTGCHGDKALAPENRWPMALKRKGPASDLADVAKGTAMVEDHAH